MPPTLHKIEVNEGRDEFSSEKKQKTDEQLCCRMHGVIESDEALSRPVSKSTEWLALKSGELNGKKTE